MLLFDHRIASLMFMLGYFDRAAAIFIWFILACYFARNPLIANPALPYLGWMLLAHAFMPKLDVLELKTTNDDVSDAHFWRFVTLSNHLHINLI